jgi:phosphate transport system permease protein
MSEASLTAPHPTGAHTSEDAVRRLRRRYAAERRFRAYGLVAIGVALFALGWLLTSIVGRGYTAFVQSRVTLEVEFARDVLDPDGTGDPDVLSRADFSALVKASLRQQFPDVSGRRERRALKALVSSGATFELRDRLLADPSLLGTRQAVSLPLSDDSDMFLKGFIPRDVEESARRLNDSQIAWLDALQERGLVRRVFNTTFLSSGDSREPELAGVWGAVVGTTLTLAVTLFLCFPVGVASAVYLEEFARKNRWTDLIEVNINNLAAVPSIVFGLLGLAVFLNFFGLPRSAPLVGGLVLALMTLPTVIIAGRAALKAVPPSIREAALGVGASPSQCVLQHVLPLALPGILTGTIIGMARALGESAPLLMIGMVAFVVDIPSGLTSPSTVLPVQVFLWADSPERAFVEKTSAAIMVLLAFLILMNLAAVLLRRKYEQKW